MDICDYCRKFKETRACRNRICWGKTCDKNICNNCRITCGKCGDKNKGIICIFCRKVCNRCKKNICNGCDGKYGRCDECLCESPLCDYCEDVKGDYKCDQCNKHICYNCKHICYNCGTKCTDCHENYDKASCEYCKHGLSPENVEDLDV